MAFQSTTAAGTGDVLDKIRLFAIAQGWTVNRWRDSPDTSYGKELCISHADAGYFNLAHSKTVFSITSTHDNDILINASPGFDSTKNTNGQTDKSGDSRCSLYAYDATKTRNVYLFGTTQYIYVVQELTTNLYSHLCFGAIDKAWSYTGGQFVSAVWWDFRFGRRRVKTLSKNSTISIFIGSTYSYNASLNRDYIYGLSLRCDFADRTGVYWHNTDNRKFNNSYYPYPRPRDGYIEGGYPAYKNYKWRNPHGDLSNCLPQSMPALSPLLPIIPSIVKDNNFYFPGQWPDVRYVELSNINPKQEITLGDDVWMCFPLAARHIHNLPTGAYSITSGAFGVAYKK